MMTRYITKECFFMKISKILVLSAVFLICGFSVVFAASDFDSVVTQTDKGLIDWSQNYIEATGMAVAPSSATTDAQGKLLARRGAIVDLQRNMLEFLSGVQIDSRTTMDDFMAEDRVRSEVHGAIKNIELLKGVWDGEAYTVTGRIKLAQLRTIVAPSIPVDKVIIETEAKQPAAPKTARYTGLVIDARHLPLTPSVTFRVFDESGRAVYGIEFTNNDAFLQSGICSYFNNINFATGDVFVATNPISARAIKLTNGNVDIVISNSNAAMIRSSSYDFRKDCKVIIVVNG